MQVKLNISAQQIIDEAGADGMCETGDLNFVEVDGVTIVTGNVQAIVDMFIELGNYHADLDAIVVL